jgi:kumamolisin
MRSSRRRVGRGVRRLASQRARAATCLFVGALIGVLLTGCSASAPADAVAGSTEVVVALPFRVDTSGLAQAADAVADPESAQFHHFLTVSEVADRYGASPSTIRADEKTLGALGIHLRPDPTHGALWGVVSASEAQHAFGTSLVEQSGSVVPSSTPHLPGGLEDVTGVVGLDASVSLPPVVSGGSATPACPTSVPTTTSVSDLYGFNGAVAGGATGAGTTIDILAVHALESAVFANYDRCTGATLATSSISQVTVPATPSAGGGPEVSLDTLVISLLAPAAHLSVVRYDPSTSLSFPLMELLAQRSLPDVLDITVTYCEPELSPEDVGLSEWLLSALAAAGTTTVAASGDTGSSGCYPSQSPPAVTYPASSDYVASVGGASYTSTADAPQHLEVWNEPGDAGGGGGTSKVITAPPWQPSGHRRVPDVSAYAVSGGLGDIPVCGDAQDCEWLAEGGTSVAATVLGAAGLLLAQQDGTAVSPARWGNVAEPLWRLGPRNAVTDITAGSNTTFSTSCCQAAAGYDTASGWGLFLPDSMDRYLVNHATAVSTADVATRGSSSGAYGT